MLDILSAAIYIFTEYLTIFSLGYIALGRVMKSKLPFCVSLPVYLSVGLSLQTIISFAASLFSIKGLTLLLISIPTWIYILYKNRKIFLIRIRPQNLSLNFLPIVLIVLSFWYFSFAVGVLKWPPVGDIILHGNYVSLLRYNEVFRFNLQPLSPSNIWYPPGLHVLAAHYAQLTNLYSGEAILILGAVIASIMPSLLYSLTYFKTRNILLSIITYISLFLVHSSKHLEMWVFGYFYNGPYPNFFGFLSVVTTLFLSIIIMKQKEKSLRSLACLMLIGLQIAITYPSFLLAPAILILFILIKKFGLLNWIFHNIRKPMGFILVFGSLLCLPFCFLFISRLFVLPNREFLAYKISGLFFYDFIGLMVIVAGVLAVFLILRRVYIELSFLYIFTLVLSALSLNSVIYQLIWFFLPSRLIIINVILSWVILPCFLQLVYSKKIDLKTHEKSYKNFWRRISSFILIAIILSQSSLISHFSLEIAHTYGWYSSWSSFPYDHETMVWICKNIPPDDLILNDLSWSGFYLPSYTYKSVIFQYFSAFERAREAKEIWLSPENSSQVRQLLANLNIKYVVSSSERGYYDRHYFGGDGKYKAKPFLPLEYMQIFDSYTFLQKIFQKGNSTVYQVMI